MDMCEFDTVASLKNFRLVTKVKNSTFQKVYCRVAALFRIRENETSSGCFINDCVLIKFLQYKTGMAGGWNISDLHLPLNAELRMKIAEI